MMMYMISELIGLFLFLQIEYKSQLRAGLSGLPQPKNDFEIVLPDEVCKSVRFIDIINN